MRICCDGSLLLKKCDEMYIGILLKYQCEVLVLGTLNVFWGAKYECGKILNGKLNRYVIFQGIRKKKILSRCLQTQIVFLHL